MENFKSVYPQIVTVDCDNHYRTECIWSKIAESRLKGQTMHCENYMILLCKMENEKFLYWNNRHSKNIIKDAIYNISKKTLIYKETY